MGTELKLELLDARGHQDNICANLIPFLAVGDFCEVAIKLPVPSIFRGRPARACGFITYIKRRDTEFEIEGMIKVPDEFQHMIPDKTKIIFHPNNIASVPDKWASDMLVIVGFLDRAKKEKYKNKKGKKVLG